MNRPVLNAFLCCTMLAGATSSQEDARDKVFGRGLVEAGQLQYTSDDFIHLAVIASNINKNVSTEGVIRPDDEVPILLRGFVRMMDSLFASSLGTPIHLIIITDEASRGIAEFIIKSSMGHYLSNTVISNLAQPNPGFPDRFQVEFVDLESITRPHRAEIEEMKKFYSREEYPQPTLEKDTNTVYVFSGKYRLDLFYIAPFYAAAFKLNKMIVLDFDLKLDIDLKELLEVATNNMQESEVIGVAHDQMTHYRMYHDYYRKINLQLPEKTHPGVNTAVVVYDLERIRNNHIFQNQIQKDAFGKLATKYYMTGSLGDQDWMTLLSWEYPELFHILPCSYNFQLLQTRQASTCQLGYKILHGLLPGENV